MSSAASSSSGIEKKKKKEDGEFQYEKQADDEGTLEEEEKMPQDQAQVAVRGKHLVSNIDFLSPRPAHLSSSVQIFRTFFFLDSCFAERALEARG